MRTKSSKNLIDETHYVGYICNFLATCDFLNNIIPFRITLISQKGHTHRLYTRLLYFILRSTYNKKQKKKRNLFVIVEFVSQI